MLPVAILAGGLATRLGSIASSAPKSLIEVAGKPFIRHQVELLRTHGVNKVVVCIGHLGDQIVSVLGDGRGLDIAISYSRDGDEPAGTGGALSGARSLLGDRFLVLYGDAYLQCDFRAVQDAFLRSGREGLMTVFRNQNQWDRSNVIFQNGDIRAYDKGAQTPEMRHIDYGLGVFESRAFDRFENMRRFDLQEVYMDLLERSQLAAFEVAERFYEIGSAQGLDETALMLSRRQVSQRMARGS